MRTWQMPPNEMGREGGNSAALAEKLVYPVYLGGAPRVKGFRGQDFGGNEELNRRTRRTRRKEGEEEEEEWAWAYETG
jgi:hypothetical protein